MATTVTSLDLRRLWLHCAAIVALVLAVAVFANSVLTARTAAPLVSAELDGTASLIGTSVSRQLERALSYGIPIGELRGTGEWLADIVAANPVLTSLAVYDASGARLAGVGDSAGQLPAAVALPTGARLIPLRDRSGAVVGRLLAVCTSPTQSALPWFASAALASLLAAIAAWWLARGVRQRLQRPLRVYAGAAEVLREGQLPRLSIPPVRDPATALIGALAERVLRVRLRTEALIQKIAEVRAAHFDPNVLQSLDALADGLVARLGAPEVDAAAEAADSRTRLAHRVIVAALVAVALVGAAMAFDQHLQRGSTDRQLADGGARTLEVAWQATLDRDHAVLGRLLDQMQSAPGLRDALAEGDDQALRGVLESLALIYQLRVSVFDDDGAVIGDSAREDARLDAATLAPLGTASRVAGVWQNAARLYQVGIVQRVAVAGHDDIFLMVARPLSLSLRHLGGRLSAPVTAVDLRGQPLTDPGAEAQALAAEWRAHGRRSTRVDDPAGVVAALPFTGPGGHDLGTLLARLPLPPGTDLVRTGVGGMVLAVAAVLALLALATINRLFDPLLAVVARLERLARGGQTSVEPARSRESAEVDSLNRSARRLAEKIDALEMLKRSRERQGRRQARFIRHQMMQLAERLDEDARKAILDDLERIEHASHPAAATADAPAEDPNLERLVDEFGVLALGFQNLVGRVGAQYQELDRLVHELREALRAKTQFIALQQELEIARNMQLSILPRKFDGLPELAVHATMIPAKEVGGDFYDFFPLDAHRVALVVADVSGKGVPAAFFMAVSRTLLRAVAQFSDGPGACLARLNDLLAADNEEMMFVTLFYAILDTRDGSLVYANGGHNPPYLMRADGRIEALPRTNGMALAVMDGMDFAENRVTLARGDGLFLFTDGVTEACDPAQQLFGDARLVTGLQAMQSLPVREMPARLVAMIKEFEAGSAQADDITCLVVRYGVVE